MLARSAPRLNPLTPRKRTRRGVTIVEAALVMSVFLLLLFGMFEYCRFLLVLHVTNNATREGARYASVNLDKPGTFDAQDYTDASGKLYPSVQQYTKDKMAGLWKNIDGFRVAVFAADQTGLNQNPPVVRPKPKASAPAGTYPDPWDASDPNAVPWNSAPFPERIVVYVNGTYRPILPTLLLMPSSIPIDVYAITGGEG
jgi:hypothetical protein